MAIVNAQEAAKLTGKSTQTIYRDAKSGKLSKVAPGRFETAELLRVYGPFRTVSLANESAAPIPMSAHGGAEVEFLRSQVAKLQGDMAEMRAEYLERERQAVEREKRLVALLEHQQSRPESGGLFGKFFK